MEECSVLIQVKLKPGYPDPEAQTTLKALNLLGFPVVGLEIAKQYLLKLKVPSKEQAAQLAQQICLRLLANPVKDEYRIHLEQ